MSSQILCASAPAREWETFLSGQTLVSTIQAMLPARISLMYCILYPRWTPIYVGGPGSRTWTSEHPHNDRRSYKALRERDISMPAPLQSELPSRGLRCPWIIGQQRTSRENEQRETREVVLRQSSVRKTGHQRAKTHPYASSAQPSRASQGPLGVNTSQNHR